MILQGRSLVGVSKNGQTAALVLLLIFFRCGCFTPAAPIRRHNKIIAQLLRRTRFYAASCAFSAAPSPGILTCFGGHLSVNVLAEQLVHGAGARAGVRADAGARAGVRADAGADAEARAGADAIAKFVRRRVFFCIFSAPPLLSIAASTDTACLPIFTDLGFFSSRIFDRNHEMAQSKFFCAIRFFCALV